MQGHDVDGFPHDHFLVPNGERKEPMMALDEQFHDDIVQSQVAPRASTCRTSPRTSTQSFVSIEGEFILLNLFYSSIQVFPFRCTSIRRRYTYKKSGHN